MNRKLVVALGFLLGGFVVAAGCSSTPTSNGFNIPAKEAGSGVGVGSDDSGGAGTDDGSVGNFGDSGPIPHDSGGTGCTNLQCQVHSCSNGGTTTISGTVMDPAGRNPLYNVVAYIPNSPNGKLDLIPLGVNGASCSCDGLFSGEPMADTLTDAKGNFTIKNAPDGANIPLVIQIGKWRKEIFIPSVKPCQDNPQGKLPLPSKHSTNPGDGTSIPNIAVSTGSADTLECLLERVGVDPSEYTGDPNTPNGRIHVFQGSGGNAAANPASPSSPTSLWDTTTDLKRYDIVLLSCEGSPTTGANSQTVADYVNVGGRVFGEHYHYQFFANQPQFPNTANWNNVGLGGDAYPGQITTNIQTTLLNGKPFPEGQALQTWLGNVGALTNNQLVVPAGNGRYNAVVQAGNVSTAWALTDPSVSPPSAQYFSWDMPFNPPVDDAGVPQYCGRVVFSDLHVAGAAGDYGSSTTTPAGCVNQPLSPDEDALEFILFDLSSCVTPIGYPPKPPPEEAGPPQ